MTTTREQELTAEVAKWKAMARKHEDRLKANAKAHRQALRVALVAVEDAADALEAALGPARRATTDE